MNLDQTQREGTDRASDVRWHISDDPRGAALTTAALRVLLTTGSLDPSISACRVGEEIWRPLTEVPELADLACPARAEQRQKRTRLLLSMVLWMLILVSPCLPAAWLIGVGVPVACLLVWSSILSWRSVRRSAYPGLEGIERTEAQRTEKS